METEDLDRNPKLENTKVFEAISDVAKDFSQLGIGKDQRNQHGKYNFRGIDDVYNHLSPLLVRHGLLILPSLVSTERDSYDRGGDRATLWYTRVEMAYTFVAKEDGSSFTIIFPGEAWDTADKASNKALSAAYKMMALEVFCIPIEGIPDADSDHHEVSPGKASKKTASKKTGGKKPTSKKATSKKATSKKSGGELPAEARKAIAKIANAKTRKDLDEIGAQFKEEFGGNAPLEVRQAWKEKADSLAS